MTERLVRVLAEVCATTGLDAVGPTTELAGLGVALDSLGRLTLAGALAHEFDTEIEERALDPERLRTLGDLMVVVTDHLAGRAAAC